MDRIKSIRCNGLLIVALVFGVFWGLPVNESALGNVVFIPPPKKLPPSPERFPESEFGKKPADPVTGQMSSVALDGVDRKRMQRVPAGLVYQHQDQNQSGQVTKSQNMAQMPPGVHFTSGDPSKLVPSAKGVQEVALIAGDLGFFPRTVFVNRNTPVRMYITGASSSTLCIMIDAFNIRKQISTKKIEEISFTPVNPGKYRYYCPVNGMEGTLVVKELFAANQ